MENVKTSIFKQKIFETRYVLMDGWWVDDRYGDVLEEREIFRCDIPIPKLKQGESFYIEELCLSVTVSEVMRTSKDSVLYYIKSKSIDTEESLKKKDELEKKASESKMLNKYKEMNWLYKKLVSYDKFKTTHVYTL